MMTPDELMEVIELSGFEFYKGDAYAKAKPHHVSFDGMVICSDELMRFAELIQIRTKEQCANLIRSIELS